MNEQSKSAESGPIHSHPDTREEMRAAQLELVRSARHELRILTPALDAAAFNSSAMAEALGRFIADHRHNRARVVVEDTEHMIQTCTRFVELARRFSDLLIVRRLGEPHRGLREMFMMADHDSCLYQPDVALVDATLDLHAPKQAGALGQRFEEIWASTEPAPGLHNFRL
jgi:hypothetical protein